MSILADNEIHDRRAAERCEAERRVIEAAKLWRASQTEYLIECEIALSSHAPIEGGTKYRMHAAAAAMAASDLVAALQKLEAQ